MSDTEPTPYEHNEQVWAENVEVFSRAQSIEARAWEAPLSELVEAARQFDLGAHSPSYYARGDADRQRYLASGNRLMAILQARATIEGAEVQRRESRQLVRATWALVAVTLLFAIATLVATLILS